MIMVPGKSVLVIYVGYGTVRCATAVTGNMGCVDYAMTITNLDCEKRLSTLVKQEGLDTGN